MVDLRSGSNGRWVLDATAEDPVVAENGDVEMGDVDPPEVKRSVACRCSHELKSQT